MGDRNEHLPTVHGFDEFFGNLYHLNAEEEPENPDYPKDPRFRAKFGPRGVLKCKASDRDDPTVDPAFGRVGKQTIQNTGPLDTKRMEKSSMISVRMRISSRPSQRSWRARLGREGAAGPHAHRQEFQGSSRRYEPAPVPQGRHEGTTAP